MAGHEVWRCSVRASIWSERHDSWRLAQPKDLPELVKDVEVALEISGDAKDGFHLIMTPEGCFTADHWYASLAEAMDGAESIYGAGRRAWKKAARPRLTPR